MGDSAWLARPVRQIVEGLGSAPELVQHQLLAPRRCLCIQGGRLAVAFCRSQERGARSEEEVAEQEDEQDEKEDDEEGGGR